MTQILEKVQKIRKRDGSMVDFEQKKITSAIFKALTSSNVGGNEEAEKVSNKVVQILQRRFKGGQIPEVEQVQDIIEEALMLEEFLEASKAFILYREQRRRIRDAEITTDEAVEIFEKYISEMDWQVKENANMAYSLQGLNQYAVSALTRRYWLNKVYPKHIRDAYTSGEMHIHDLDCLATYCNGWDLYDLLLRGFGGVAGKVETSPAKHFRVALGQVVNFFYTIQGESAGAQAFSSVDTLLAPFIRYDNLDYAQVKQAMQEFLFNCAVPTRVGFQCLSEDTKILTANGWKSHNEVNQGDVIYTFNIQENKLEKKTVDTVFTREYEGVMYNLKNRSQDQLISPNHRVVRQIFNAPKYTMEPIEEILKLKSPVSIPVSAENQNLDYPIEDNQLKLIAWTLAEGTIEKDGSHRVTIYQSPQANPENYQEIIGLLNGFSFDYTKRMHTSLGTCCQIRLLSKSSQVIHQWLGGTVKKVPDFLYQVSKRQAKLFLETYVKGDGWTEKYRQRITTTDPEILESLQVIAVLAGYNFTTLTRKFGSESISKKDQYVLTITTTKHDYIQEIKTVEYKGVIWSVHTNNETVIAKRKGQVFITGNTPFSNVTLDIHPSPSFTKQPVIIGGKPQKETYAEFQEEMNMFNNAFFEVMMEGDKNGRPFTFPIPTINITKDFPWDDPKLDLMWQATAKYGTSYFTNFIQSDMKPEDVRSMCCRLRLNNKELYKRGGSLFGANPLTGSIGVVTINLPRIGYSTKTKKEYFEKLAKLMDIARDSLEMKRKALEDLMKKGLYPYSKVYLAGIEKMRGAYLGNHFSTIGLLGLNESLLNFMGEDIGSKNGRIFALEVLDFMRERIIGYQKETDSLFNLEATPAEGASHKLALKDKEKCPGIIQAGTSEAPYYTNSSQLPVNYTDDIFRTLELQDELQCKYTGGTVQHIFLGEQITDIANMKALIKKVFENFHLPYITLTPTFSICPTHGYLSGEHWKCPKCTIDQTCEVYSRVVGYIRPIKQWHKGKAQEFKERKNFQVPKIVENTQVNSTVEKVSA